LIPSPHVSTSPLRLEIETADGHRLEIFEPSSDPAKWSTYLEGAEREYRRFDVLAALPLADLKDPANVALAFLIYDGWSPIGGVRIHGPYVDLSGIAALREMACSPQFEWFERYLGRLVACEQVIEIKGTWSAYDSPDRRLVSRCVGRCPILALDVLQADRVVATSPQHTMPVYLATGAKILEEAGTSPYPSDAYETQVVEITRAELSETADPIELAAIRKERSAVAAALRADR